jgi:hypothetical protein
VRSSAFSFAAKLLNGDEAASRLVAPICCKNFLREDWLCFDMLIYLW